MIQDVRLDVEGISCAACTLRIERALRQTAGILSINANAATAEVRVAFDTRCLTLEEVLRRIRELGFTPHLGGSSGAEAARLAERRAALRRLAAAGFGMMQTMMFAFGLYASSEYQMDPAIVGLLRYSSLLVAVPVTLYAGAPIFRAAALQVRRRQPGMDVPVGLGLALALAASVLHTFTGQGSVYFESVTMFLFFLGAARFVEMSSRHEAGSVTQALAAILPDHALRLAHGRTQRVPTSELRAGEEILVNRGDRVPADGVIVAGATSFNEALLTGESNPVRRSAGDFVTGGSINLGAGVRIRVTATGTRSIVAGIIQLLEGSRRRKPRVPTAADSAARLFSSVILLLAALTCAGWLAIDPSRAFAATLAVLVVACPCALALAAPAVTATANAALARLGLLVVSADAVDQLAPVRHIIVDKTGTLTAGQPTATLATLYRQATATEPLAIAAAIERGSSHPIASAFRMHEDSGVQASAIVETPGQGLEAAIGGQRFRIGRPQFVSGLRTGHWQAAPPQPADDASCVLGDADGPLASFDVTDPVRADARNAVADLQAAGYTIEIASGDSPAVVSKVAAGLGIGEWHARMSPAAKVERIEKHQATGSPVLMIGDGVNDAPTLGAAHVAIAMYSGSALAQSSADLVMLDGAWRNIPDALLIARGAQVILRQNLLWAVIYNLSATPLAALGLVPPWLAALGMSLSSLVVVLNSGRAARIRRRERARRQPDDKAGQLAAPSPLMNPG